MKKTPDSPREMETPPPMPAPKPSSGGGSASKVVNAIKQAPDVLRNSIPGAVQNPKEGLTRAITTARETIIGNGSLPDEIKELGGSFLKLPADITSSALTGLGKLVTLHPIKATGEFASGIGRALRNVTSIATSPSRLAVAGGASGVSLARKTAKLPFKAVAGVAKGAVKSPFWVWNRMNAGLDKLFDVGKRIEAWNQRGGIGEYFAKI